MAGFAEESIRVRRHVSHTKSGRRVIVSGSTEYRKEPYPRHTGKIPINKNNHVGYSSHMTPEQNVVHGRMKRYSYLTVGRQLQALANIEKRTNPEAAKVFRKGAMLAFRMHAAREQ